MIILGHKIIKCENFAFIKNIEDIKNTPSNSVVLLNYNLEIMDYCLKNKIQFGVFISSITEAIFSNSLMAKYLIVNDDIAIKIQKIGENYMFDSKIIIPIKDDGFIEVVAKNGIDGVIYDEFLKGIIR